MLFLSYSVRDRSVQEDVFQFLLDYGYSKNQVFVDREIDFGDEWRAVLHERLKSCAAIIVLHSFNWKYSNWCQYELGYARSLGKEVFPFRIDHLKLQGMLSEHQGVSLLSDDEPYEQLVQNLEAKCLGPRDPFVWPNQDLEDVCPYPGLPGHDERYAAVYYGRRSETQGVIEELNKMHSDYEPRMIVIHGGSGSGKSSLLNAGVLPRLRSSADWIVLPAFRFGSASQSEFSFTFQLARLLWLAFPENQRPEYPELRKRLAKADSQEAKENLGALLHHLIAVSGTRQTAALLPIDQFEELLQESKGASRFLMLIQYLLTQPDLPFFVIATMRSGYLDEYDRHPLALPEPLRKWWRLPPMGREQLDTVIRAPAKRVSVHVEDELVERLKEDTPSLAALPLLALTLESLYRARQDPSALTLEDYERKDGMSGALRHIIDDVVPWPELTSAEQQAVRLAFVKHLSQRNEQGDVIRRIADWTEIPDEAERTLRKLVTKRLLVDGTATGEGDEPEEHKRVVEVAHEALFDCWPQLEEWLEQSGEVHEWRRDVERATKKPKWNGLSPAQREVARPWLRHRRDELFDVEVKLIQQAVWWHRALIGGIVVLVGMMCLGGAALAIQSYRTQVAEKNIEIEQQRTQIANQKEENSRFNELLSTATEETEVRRAGWTERGMTALREASQLASASSEQLRIKELAAKCVGGFDVIHDGHLDFDTNVYCLAFSPDGKWLAVGEYRGVAVCNVRIFDFEGRKLVRTLPFFTLDRARYTGIRTLAFSPNGRWLAAGGRSGRILCWDTHDKESDVLHPVWWKAHDSIVSRIVFLDDDRIASCSEHDTNQPELKVWDRPQITEQFEREVEIDANAANGLLLVLNDLLKRADYFNQPRFQGADFEALQKKFKEQIEAAQKLRESQEYLKFYERYRDDLTGALDHTSLDDEGKEAMQRIVDLIDAIVSEYIKHKAEQADPFFGAIAKRVLQTKSASELGLPQDGLDPVGQGLDEFLNAVSFAVEPTQSKPFSKRISDIAYDTNHKALACATEDGLKVLAAADLDELFTHKAYFRKLRFSDNGQSIIGDTGVDVRFMEIDMSKKWARTSGRLESQNGPIHDRQISRLGFHPNGSLVVTAAADRAAKVSSRVNNRVVTIPLGDTDHAFPTFSPDGRFMVVNSKRKLVVYKLNGFSVRNYEALSENPITAFAVSPDGRHTVVLSERIYTTGAKLSVWNRSDGEFVRSARIGKLPPPNEVRRSLSFHPDQPKVALTVPKFAFYSYEKHEADVSDTLEITTPIHFSDAGNQLWFGYKTKRQGSLLATIDPTLDIETKWTNNIGPILVGQSELTGLCVRRNHVLVGSNDGWTRLFPADASGEISFTHSWQTTEDRVKAVALSHDEKIAVWGTENGLVRFAHTDSTEILELRRHDDIVEAVAFSADDQLLVTGSRDGTLKIWKRMESGFEASLNLRVDGPVQSLVFNSGKLFVLVKNQPTVQVWDLQALNEALPSVIATQLGGEGE